MVREAQWLERHNGRILLDTQRRCEDASLTPSQGHKAASGSLI